jgi:hypothetical protein
MLMTTKPATKVKSRSLAGTCQSALASVTRTIDRWRGEKLKRDQARFLKLYRRLSAQRFSQRQRQPGACPGVADEQIDKVVTDLRKDGIAVWPGLLTDSAILNPLRALMNELAAEWNQVFATQPPDARRVVDAGDSRVYLRSGTIQNGRTRVSFQGQQLERAPAPIQAVARDPRLAEVCSRYFDIDATCSYVLAEKLEPSEEGDWWHIDRITDQVKVMVLLNDVGMNQGPLQFKAGTHLGTPELGPVYHQVFACGVDYAYPPGPLVQQLAAATHLGTGRAGDCIFFDTLGVHSGTRCLSGERLALVGTYFGDTCRSRTLQRLRKGWI